MYISQEAFCICESLIVSTLNKINKILDVQVAKEENEFYYRWW